MYEANQVQTFSKCTNICTTLTESKEKILKRWLSLCADNLVSLQTYIQELGIPKGNVLFVQSLSLRYVCEAKG